MNTFYTCEVNWYNLIVVFLLIYFEFCSPQGWKPPFAVNVETFTFTPRVQPLNELEVIVTINFVWMVSLVPTHEVATTE